MFICLYVVLFLVVEVVLSFVLLYVCKENENASQSIHPEGLQRNFRTLGKEEAAARRRRRNDCKFILPEPLVVQQNEKTPRKLIAGFWF